METMKLQQALICMLSGKKMTNNSLRDNEYISFTNGNFRIVTNNIVITYYLVNIGNLPSQGWEEWIEPVETVDFMMAFNHMKKGGKAKVEGSETINSIEHGFLYYYSFGTSGSTGITIKMVEAEWVLL